MTRWEYAAIVGDGGAKWTLREHGKMTKFECTIEFVFEGPKGYALEFKSVKHELEKKKLAKVKGLPSKNTFHVIYEMVDTWKQDPAILAQKMEGYKEWGEGLAARFSRGDTTVTSRMICDYKSAMTLFQARDILALVNKAGAKGWEITGGLGLNDGYWRHINDGGPVRETRWRMMRREL